MPHRRCAKTSTYRLVGAGDDDQCLSSAATSLPLTFLLVTQIHAPEVAPHFVPQPSEETLAKVRRLGDRVGDVVDGVARQLAESLRTG
jgi:hypothetical protein